MGFRAGWQSSDNANNNNNVSLISFTEQPQMVSQASTVHNEYE